MKKLKQYGPYGILFTVVATCLNLIFSGCSEQPETEADPYPEMSSGLRALQGTWVDINTNDAVECTAIFQGFTIRIRYQAGPEELTQKQNAAIDRLDEARNLVLINGGTGAWPYTYLQDNGTENLQLEFFTSDGWHKVNLNRAD